MKPLVFSLVVLLAAAATAGAAGRHALILCNQNYKSIGVLKTPLAEADAAKKTLAALGFEGNITVVTDATTAKMTEAVDTFASKLTDADVALFFYGGHAVQAGGENYLLGTDSDPSTNSQLAYKALPLGRVLTNFEGSGARLKLLILDCCRDNPLPARGRNIGGARGLAPLSIAPKGTFIAYAADANQQAWDDHGQIGLYGSVLFEKMKAAGLRLEDIFIQTREEVSKVAKEKYNHQQEPAEYSKVSGVFYFASAPRQVPATMPAQEPARPASIAMPAVAANSGAKTATQLSPALVALLAYYDCVNIRALPDAWVRLSRSFKSRTTLESYREVFADTTSATIVSARVTGQDRDTATIEVTLRVKDAKGKPSEWRGPVVMMLEDGMWKLDNSQGIKEVK